MADETKAEIGKKCAFSGVPLRKAKRYYRNGLYFRNRAAFKGHEAKQKEKSAAESAEQPAQG